MNFYPDTSYEKGAPPLFPAEKAVSAQVPLF
jgi:hypothetical protein